MTAAAPSREDSLVAEMPPLQRESVRQRIQAATAAGWTHIGTWVGWALDSRGRYMPLPPDENDLFGVPPGEQSGCKPIP